MRSGISEVKAIQPWFLDRLVARGLPMAALVKPKAILV
jgi:hypothetical protein